jgi:Flp pilus assembly pilin Flp
VEHDMTILTTIRSWLQRRCTADSGASLVEYALLVSLIAVASVLAVAGLGTDVNNQFSSLTELING